ncbi:MAG TPA: hypothetical protein VG795_03700 [Acidimicrobiia bacterium]|nr:hypothetical protein [Acidimicrobiia bacterium]
MEHDRRPDPFDILTQTMRRMADLRLDDITRGLNNFANPSARGMLESMGRTRDEQVETLAAMLHNSTEEDIAEMGEVFGLAMAKLAEERAGGAERPPPPPSTDRPRGRRDHSAAEWRKQRRRAS